MVKRFEKYKGIHPGFVLERELKKRCIKQRPFALALDEHPQTFNAILKGKRGLPVSLALKIEKELELEESTLSILQLYYDIKQEKQKCKSAVPDLSKLRKSLFWDTDVNEIDWEKQYKAVIRRVWEKGNNVEKKEIERYYGATIINQVMKSKSIRQPILQPILNNDVL